MPIKLKISELTTKEGGDQEGLMQELITNLERLKREHLEFSYTIEGNTLLRNITIKSVNLCEHVN